MSDSNYLDLFKKYIDEQSVETLTEKELVIDGNNLFIRSFCADPRMNASGMPVGGLYGFIKALSMMSKYHRPTKIFITFDGKESRKLRSKILSEYKAHRGTKFRFNRPEGFAEHIDEEEAFHYQLIKLGEVLDTLPIMTIAPDGLEADDVISFLVKKRTETNPNAHMIIVSADKDLLQLVSERCWVYSPVKQIMYNIAEVEREFGLHHKNFILAKLINGDLSDGISGVDGVGFKKLIKLFPIIVESPITINDIFNICQERMVTKRPLKTYQKILDSVDIIRRNEELMILDGRLLSDSMQIKLNEFLNYPPESGDYSKFVQRFGLTVTGLSPTHLSELYNNITQHIVWKT